jgi:Asp-tRNA(Asn)/Glu-tRNA(Gln) amidotransferase A subunit family amidase
LITQQAVTNRCLTSLYQSSTFKRKQRAERFASLPAAYHAPLSAFDRDIINKSIEEIVEDVHNGTLAAKSVLTTYGKVAVRAQERTNCVTEILLPEAEEWLEEEIDLNGPLAGIPVSLKDSLQVKGFDTTLGYARWADKPLSTDGAMVRLLKDAGACLRIILNFSILGF